MITHMWCSNCTTDSILKRCIRAVPLTNASIAFEPKDPSNQEELKALAQHLFTLLQEHDGFLVLLFNGAPRAASLLVTHTQDGWTLDSEPCLASPPVLDMNAIPKGFFSAKAQFYSKVSHGFMSALRRDGFHAVEGIHFDLEREAKAKFAYNHNINIDA